jgi:hypothetical protein
MVAPLMAFSREFAVPSDGLGWLVPGFSIACLPSKNITHSAKVASYFRRSQEFGIASGGFRIEMSAYAVANASWWLVKPTRYGSLFNM